MNKAQLEAILRTANTDYVWTLYFFNSRKQRGKDVYSYDGYEIRFTKNATLVDYATSLISAVLRYQVAPLDQILVYDGFNNKCSCDSLRVTDGILSENFTAFRNSLALPDTGGLKDYYKGYALMGQPSEDVDGKAITFLKFANPTAKLRSKKSVFFKKARDNESNDALDEITEQFFRMYLTVDTVLIDDVLYNFTHAFEKIFGVTQTLHQIKARAIDKIVEAGFIANEDDFRQHAQSQNSRRFVTLSDDRIALATNEKKRSELGATYNIPIDENGLFLLSDADHTDRLLKYLCYKAFKDADTSEMLEASSVTKLNIGDAT